MAKITCHDMNLHAACMYMNAYIHLRMLHTCFQSPWSPVISSQLSELTTTAWCPHVSTKKLLDGVTPRPGQSKWLVKRVAGVWWIFQLTLLPDFFAPSPTTGPTSIRYWAQDPLRFSWQHASSWVRICTRLLEPQHCVTDVIHYFTCLHHHCAIDWVVHICIPYMGSDLDSRCWYQ